MASNSGPGRKRTPGNPRRPGRTRRTRARIVGVAGLATAAVGSLTTPAAAVPGPATAGEAPAGADRVLVADVGLDDAAGVAESLAESLAGQARTQRRAAAAHAAQEAAERAEARRERAQEARAERAAERAALRRHVLPVQGSYVSTAYGAGGGQWSSGAHTGVDFHAASGTRVGSVAVGEVVEAGWSGSYGYNVVIRHRDGMYTQYGHLSSVSVGVGAQVSAGQQIGLSGSTGNTTGPHLHFEVRIGPDYGSDVDPLAYLRRYGIAV
ncbi:murein hydrolase activator EnvC family protein [Streptomyces sp. TR06-5]|uniref:murein hydrolase activator EnvC family protein n=1 Tax=Streptomyces sp. TR06-5 TaxID=3385976 RepID=UPI0039A1794E